MTVLDWIIRYWVQWLFGLICAALLAGYRRLAKRVKASGCGMTPTAL